MTTVEAFNTMLKSFLGELAEVFPEERQIRLSLDTFDTLVAITPRAPLDMVVDSLAPHTGLAMAKDPALFDKLKFPGGIDFAKLWASDVSDNTREAIWQYINLLFLLGTTVRSMPDDMLQNIENVAKSCADRMEAGQMPDFTMLGSMLAGGLAGGLPAGLPSAAAATDGERGAPRRGRNRKR